jgi:protease YdgD
LRACNEQTGAISGKPMHPTRPLSFDSCSVWNSLRVITVFASVCCFSLGTADANQILRGEANVLAGDKIGLAGRVVILQGIEAPEPAQGCKRRNKPWACGRLSANTLRDLIQDREVRCTINGSDNQARLIGTCRANGTELNARMVQTGMALVSAGAPTHYRNLQTAAKSAGRGIWSAQFIHPTEWRRGKRLPGMAAFHPELKGSSDDRIIVDPRKFPWRTIGRIDNGGHGYCSGVLISPTLVLTAGHCVYNKRTKQPYPAATLHFSAGLKGDRFVAHSRAKRVLPSPYFALRAKATSELAPDDWAVMELVNPIGDTVGYIGWAYVDPQDIGKFHRDHLQFVQAGYSQDRPRGISAHIGCEFIGSVDQWNLAHHNCDAINGSSGSPIFYIERGEIRVVGVHAATIDLDNNKVGGAVLTHRFANDLAKIVPEASGKLPPGKLGKDAKRMLEQLDANLKSKPTKKSERPIPHYHTTALRSSNRP